MSARIPRTCRFRPPPVYTGYWTEEDWAKWIGPEEIARARREEAKRGQHPEPDPPAR